MAWDKSKPEGSRPIREGDDAIRDNNDALEDALGRDHLFPGAMGSTAGEHTVVTLGVQSTDPAAAAGKGKLYSKLVSAVQELLYRNPGGNITQLTNNGTLNLSATGITATAAQVNDVASTSTAKNLHIHGNITSPGAIGSTANLPIITGSSGVLQAGSFGSGANTFCQGNDSRLSDARTPVSHAHGNIANGGTVGSTANLPLITGTSGIIQASSFGSGANTFCQGNDSRLSDARTPTSHTHGNITNAGAIGSTSGVPIITGSSGVLQAGSFGTSAGTFCQGNDSRLASTAFRGCLAYKTTDGRIPDSELTDLLFDAEYYDTDSIHSTSSNTARLTVPSGVAYVRLTSYIHITQNSATHVVIYLVKNSSTIMMTVNPAIDSGIYPIGVALTSPVLPVTAGDYFRISVLQVGSSDFDVDGHASSPASQTSFGMEIVG